MQVINTGSRTVATWGTAAANEVDAPFLYYYDGTDLSDLLSHIVPIILRR